MIRVDQIPDEVKATMEWMILRGEDWGSALAAALSAWPGATVRDGTAYMSGRPVMKLGHLILPLPQKDGDA